MSIKRCVDKLVTKVYRKDTHTQRYINWRSNHSKNCKLGTLKGLIHRAHLLCDLKDDLLDELQLLRDVFISNGYPSKLVEKTIKDSWRIELEKELKNSTMDSNDDFADHPTDDSGYYDVFHAPYIAGLSERLAKDLKTLNIEEHYLTLYANLNLHVHKMTERMLFIALAVNHVITVTSVKPNNCSAQGNTSTNTL